VTTGFTAGQERNQHSVLRMVVKQHKIWKLAKRLTEGIILDAFGKSHRRDPQMQCIYISKTIKQNTMTQKKEILLASKI
jgi:hypothetical protein